MPDHNLSFSLPASATIEATKSSSQNKLPSPRLRSKGKAIQTGSKSDTDDFLAEADGPISGYLLHKDNITRLLGAYLLILASPVIGVLALLVYCTSRGSGFYPQKRVGKNGVEFTMYKLRTMRDDAEEGTGPVWSTPDDPRLTKVGRLLRFLHLDELPQLVNVARGEMNLIGPRPERPEIIDGLIQRIPGYRKRYRVLPGITGLAQIFLPPDENDDSVRAKLVLDEAYIQTASMMLDIRILLCSFLRMFGIRHGRAIQWLGLNLPKTNGVAYHPEPKLDTVDMSELVEKAPESSDVDSPRKTNGVKVRLDLDGQSPYITRVDINPDSVEINPPRNLHGGGGIPGNGNGKNGTPHHGNGKATVSPIAGSRQESGNGHPKPKVSENDIPVNLPKHAK